MFWVFGPEACGILAPQPGIKLAPPALEDEVLTTGPPALEDEVLTTGPPALEDEVLTTGPTGNSPSPPFFDHWTLM